MTQKLKQLFDSNSHFKRVHMKIVLKFFISPSTQDFITCLRFLKQMLTDGSFISHQFCIFFIFTYWLVLIFGHFGWLNRIRGKFFFLIMFWHILRIFSICFHSLFEPFSFIQLGSFFLFVFDGNIKII